MEVSIAAAEAVKQANVDVISAYPITPQTHIVEHLSELVANGDLDADFVCVESEHSALSVCVGSGGNRSEVIYLYEFPGTRADERDHLYRIGPEIAHRHDRFEPDPLGPSEYLERS